MMDDFEFENSIYKHSRTIIHIDIDCFYAQCEMLKNPGLVNKPLGIKQKDYIITSNYVARDFGLKKCMLISDALSLCPQLVIVNGEDLYDYRKMSASVTEVIKEFTNKVEKLGFDENFVDVSELVASRLNRPSFSTPIKIIGHVYDNIEKSKCTCGCNERLILGSVIADEIRNKIKEVLKLTCSAGIAHNKLLAKLVSSKYKPDQQTTIFPSSVLILMSSLSGIRSIPGVGRKTSDILNKLNINCIVDVQNCPLYELEKHLGKITSDWILKSSFGIDDSDVKISGKPQTLSIEDAFRKISSIEDVQVKFSNLIERLLVLIREDGRLPSTIRITIRNSSYRRESRQCNLNPAIVNCDNASNKILVIAMQLFRTLIIDPVKPFHLTLLGIGFTKFKNVFTGKKSIDSFFRKFCSNVNQKESNEINDGTISENTDNELSSVLFKCEEENFQNSNLSNQMLNIDIPISNNEKSTSFKSVKKYSLEENNYNVLQSQETNGMDSPVLDELPDEIRAELLAPCLNTANTHNPFKDTSEVLNCPDGIDKGVFFQLPADIQQELINSTKSKTPTKTNSLNKLNMKSKVLKKKNPSLGQANKIKNYFFKS